MLNFIKGYEKFYKIIIILADLALVNLAYILAFLFKFDGSLPDFNFSPYLQAMPFITVAALVLFDIFGMLKFYRKTLYDAVVSIVFVVILLGITTTAITYFRQGYSFPRSVLLLAPVFQFILLSLWKGFIFYLKKLFAHQIRLMIVGVSDEIESIIDKVSFTIMNSNLVIQYVYTPQEFDKIVKRIKDIDEVLICPGVSDEQKLKIMSYCLTQKKVVYVVPHLFEISMLNARLVQFEDIPAFMIDSLGLTVEQRFFKRVFDIVFSAVAIVLLSPIMLTAALLVRLTSPGGVIYIQERVTANNKVYNMYKFRTMVANAEQETGPVISGKDDPRVTRVGKVMRKFRIDELPQFFNVLLGDMSIVGPRSERPYFVEQFERDIPEYSHRSTVKAGITGFAQVLGNYDTSPEDKLRYDLMYIKNYSLLLDLRLIFQTIKVVLTGSTTYNGDFYKNLEKQKKMVHF